MKILHAVEKGFLLYIFISTISIILFCFAGSFALRDCYVVFRVLCLLMLKTYRPLSILERDSGQGHMKTDSMPLSSHMSRTSARFHVYKIQTSQTPKRPPHPLVNCTHTQD